MTGWSDYYSGEVTPDLYIRNLYGQREFLNEIIQTNASRILEVGAGTGTMSVFLSQLGRRVTTLDNDPKVAELAKATTAKFGGKNEVVTGDAFHLPFPDNSFDLVFHQGLLEHSSDAEVYTLLKEHLRVAPVVLVSMPNQNYPRRDFGNERLLSRQQWEKILSPFKVTLSKNYSLKILPKPWLLRAPVQYMAKVERQ